MKTKAIQEKIAKKPVNLETLAARVIREPGLLGEILDGLDADTAKVRYGCLKLLRVISERAPHVLYPEINRFFQLLDSKNTILKWGAIIIVGNLAVVDTEGKIDRMLDRYLQPISGHVLITAANVIGGAGRIAQAKPHLADRIARSLLRVEAASYQTEECRNVALGHAVESLDRAFENIRQRRPVMRFVRRQLCNRRNAVRQKAARFLKRHDQVASG